ncbi:MAG: hypothetical protein IPN47_20450 [Gemmatimonadetes bacterium]|nr:hypothetical protein [Gemmatimonadota bacterium]
MTSPTHAQTGSEGAPTIGEVFAIPTQVHQGDFVLKLTEGVDERHADTTLRDYVVTPQLVSCFKDALGLIKGALDAGGSRGAYLHGSFGSGKSHFMAVLSLLLDGNTRARAIQELVPLVADNRGWLGEGKVLVVPMHLINAVSLESAVLGQYARHVRQRHPDCATPGFYRGDKLFADARNLRSSMGDISFFAKLSAASAGQTGWGSLGSGWDADAFEAAMDAPPGDSERSRLVGDLVDTFFTSAAGLASTHDEGYVPLDEGMVILTQHARSLGYDGVVLFLDEVMLWLASNAANPSFLTTEAQKLVALVETANMRREIPVVSFLARQRDLRQLVGEHLAGAEQQAIEDVLRYWEGRFATIKLEDRNLPAIIEKRLLRPVSDSARALIEEAHARTEQIRGEVLNILLTREGDRQQFKQVYPFSPVLVQALIALSSLLQRERTALKLLVQLLSNQRDSLRLGDVMPVGELWGVIAEGTEQPFSAVVREKFDQARKLWRTKLLPLLDEEKAGAIAGGMAADAAEMLFRNDQRLMATLVLAALAEGVESLDGLTSQKLAALNHGTVRSRIPGQEARTVLEKLRRWAGRVGEIRFSETGASPTVSLHLVGVDTEVILENAQAADTPGARVQKVRALLFEMADIPITDTFLNPERRVAWRGTTRTVEILFKNVRTMAPEQFLPSEGDRWRLVIDYPFDEPGQTPLNDRAAVQQARARGQEGHSIVWLLLPHAGGAGRAGKAGRARLHPEWQPTRRPRAAPVGAGPRPGARAAQQPADGGSGERAKCAPRRVCSHEPVSREGGRFPRTGHALLLAGPGAHAATPGWGDVQGSARPRGGTGVGLAVPRAPELRDRDSPGASQEGVELGAEGGATAERACGGRCERSPGYAPHRGAAWSRADGRRALRVGTIVGDSLRTV